MRPSSAGLAAVLALAGAGLALVLGVRFATGDVYPPMSTYRTDPLGAKAIYEALGRLPGIRVERNLRRQLKPERATAFVLGLAAYSLQGNAGEIEAFTKAGGRVVISFAPETVAGAKPGHRKLGWEASATTGPGTQARVRGQARESLLYFTDLGSPWRVLRTGQFGPTVIERNLNAGSLVLSADSYALSNEGLAGERDSNLLAALAGANTRMIFDEHHLGVAEQPGVAMLMRRFKLHALLAAAVMTALLFFWCVSSTFPPGAAEEIRELEGFDSASGLVRLLERNVPRKRLLAECVEEWSRTARVPKDRLEAARAAAGSTAAASDPAGTYREIQGILERK